MRRLITTLILLGATLGVPATAAAHSPGYGYWTGGSCSFAGYHYHQYINAYNGLSYTSVIWADGAYDLQCTGNVKVTTVSNGASYSTSSTGYYVERVYANNAFIRTGHDAKSNVTNTWWGQSMT
mgnify:CR=1 FL=1